MTAPRWPAVAGTVLALVGSTAAEGQAKCAPARYRFEVRVVSAADGRPVPGATVALFVNDHRDELPRWRGSPEDASTWLDGRLQADYAFDTASRRKCQPLRSGAAGGRTRSGAPLTRVHGVDGAAASACQPAPRAR
jgi:hypothetical protein